MCRSFFARLWTVQRIQDVRPSRAQRSSLRSGMWPKRTPAERGILVRRRLPSGIADELSPRRFLRLFGFPVVLRSLEGIPVAARNRGFEARSEEHTSELQSRLHLVCRLLLEKKNAIFSCGSSPFTQIPNRTPSDSNQTYSSPRLIQSPLSPTRAPYVSLLTHATRYSLRLYA